MLYALIIIFYFTQRKAPYNLSWKTHPENCSNFQFSGSWARPYYWKTHPCEFHEDLLRFCNIHEQDCITGKFIHVALVLVKDYFRLNALFWMSFPVILPVSCPKILKLTVGWVFQANLLELYSRHRIGICFDSEKVRDWWRRRVRWSCCWNK